MSGSSTRSSQGPPGTRRAALCVAAALALAVGAGAAGCAASTATPLPAEPPGAPPVPDPDRLRDALAALAPATADVAPDSFLAAALRARGLTPPLEDRFRFGTPEGPRVVAALVPGGHPAWRDSLVVAVAAGGVAQAALLEAAYHLSARAAYTQAPGRSVLVAFTPAGQTEAALARVLALPVWAPGAVAHVVWVGEGAEPARAAAAERGLRFTAAAAEGPAPGDVAAAAALTLAAYEAIRVAARPPARPIVSVVPADSSLVPPDGR